MGNHSRLEEPPGFDDVPIAVFESRLIDRVKLG